MWWLSAKRRYCSWRCEDAQMRAFLSASMPAAGSRFSDVEFMAIDLETTSLQAADGEIASMGWVIIKEGVVQLSSAEHYYSKIKSGVGQSAVIHQIRDSELDNALPVAEIMTRLLEVAAGKVLVFHNASLDMDFLNATAMNLYTVPLLAPVVDTLLMEQRRLMRKDTVLKSGVLRLHSCRQRYGLPDYPAHDALTDALATAELLLAWVSHAGGREGIRLRDCF